MTPARGRFITLEGGEGVGKSTQAVRLAEALRTRGRDVVLTREPGGTPGAEAIRDLLMTGDEDRWSARAEALLFAAARADHAERVIRPALDAGRSVVCDRFIDSTRAYQGGAGGVEDREIVALHAVATGDLWPDRTLLLSLPSEDALKRLQSRDGAQGDRFGRKGAQYHARLLTAFETLAAADPARIRTVDASGAAADVTDRLLAALVDLL